MPEPKSNVKVERPWQLLRQPSVIASTDERIQIDVSDQQFKNAALPKVETLQPESNVNSKRLLQSLKHSIEMV
jgi:hypothetical protein